MDRLFLCVIVLAAAPLRLVLCQDLDVHGRFQVDSIEIGSVFPYSLSLKYPKHYTVLFPDSSYAFSPFEFHHKTFSPTQTEGEISYDSVVYFLSSFELDSVQRLSLPIFIIQSKDCTQTVYAKEDSVLLTHLITDVPDSVSARQLPLKTNTVYQVVKRRLNYPVIVAVGCAIIAVGIGVWLIFGKSIRKYFLIRRLHKKHLRFVQAFEKSVQQLQSDYSVDAVQATLLIWKKYMEILLTKPFTKYTSKEIFQSVENSSLHEALKQIDRYMYSKKTYTGTGDNLFWRLQDFSEYCYQKIIIEAKNG